MGASRTFRPARGGDLDAMERIERVWPSAPGWSRAQLAEEIGSPRALTLVAEEDGRVVAFACLWRVAGEAQVLDVAVAPESTRRGLGGALLRELLSRAGKEGLEKATLEVSERNLPARRLYEGAGFRVVGRRAKYYNDGSDALLMDKDL